MIPLDCPLALFQVKAFPLDRVTLVIELPEPAWDNKAHLSHWEDTALAVLKFKFAQIWADNKNVQFHQSLTTDLASMHS